jgi:branched-chain amino acid transport system permease protein
MTAANTHAAAFGRRARWRPAEIVFWIAVAGIYFVFPHHLVLASQILITALFALSLDLLLGYGGMISLGHAAFFGIGAYAAGIMATHGWNEPITGLIASAAIAALFGYVTGFIIVRLNGVALLMVTMGLGLLVAELANVEENITGGSDGMSGIDLSPILGRFAFDMLGRAAFVYVLVIVFIGFALVRRVVHSPFGLSLQGYRENPARMAQIGAPMASRLRLVNAMAAGLAGLAGALLTQTTQFVGLDYIGFERSAEVLIILILGGGGRLYGGLVGALVFMVGRNVFSEANPQYWYFWLGLLLVLIVLFMPSGLLGGADRILGYARRRIGWSRA